MPSSKEYLSYIMEQLAPLEGITTRQMMGEYIIYYPVSYTHLTLPTIA